MYNKKLFILLGVIVAICFNFLWLSSMAIKLDLWNDWKGLDDDFKKKISTVHFKNQKWNNFWWFIYFNQLSWWLSAAKNVNVDGDGVTYNCRQQVEWFYYNEERWDRLRPLDEKTANIWWMADVNFDGGIYTRCTLSGYAAALQDCAEGDKTEDEREECERSVKNIYRDTYWYYGFVEHEYSWQKMKLVVWTDYKDMNGWIVLSGSLEPSLIRVGNKFPVWFIYDYNWWVWFVWCKVNNDVKDVFNVYKLGGSIEGKSKWDNYFKVNDGYTWIDLKSGGGMGGLVLCDDTVWSAKDTLLSIVVEWIVWMGKNSNSDWYVWNQGNEKMQLFSSVDVNNTTLINYAKQKAETLCRGKWMNAEPSSSFTDSLVCIDIASAWTIDASAGIYSGKTLIVKWWHDVSVRPDKDKVYDIFIDSWNLLVQEDPADTQYVIGSNWFISDGIEEKAFLIKSFMYVNWWGDALPGNMDVYSEANDILINHDGICTSPDLSLYKQEFCLYFDELFGDEDGIIEISEVYGYYSSSVGISSDNRYSSIASVIKWNFIVNWKIRKFWLFPLFPLLNNKYFIYWKFTTKDSFSNLEQTFRWRCNKWTDTNWVPCLQLWGNPYSNAALSIIDQNYDSPLFK